MPTVCDAYYPLNVENGGQEESGYHNNIQFHNFQWTEGPGGTLSLYYICVHRNGGHNWFIPKEIRSNIKILERPITRHNTIWKWSNSVPPCWVMWGVSFIQIAY